jgi:SAM-dependent methyltransferase
MSPATHRVLVSALVSSALAACSGTAPPPSAPATPASPTTLPASVPAAPPHEHGDHEHGAHEHGAHQQGFHKDFSDAAGFAAHFDDPARDAWQHPDAVIELMAIRTGSTVADLGAGTGYFVGKLAQRVGKGGKVLALDIEPEMIAFLGRRVKEQQLDNVEPRLVVPDDPGLTPASVSRILIVNTWHHIDERPSYSRKLAAALAPGGEIWIVDFTLESDLGPPAQYRLPATQVVRELEQGGLHAQIVDPEPLPKQYIVRAAR